MIPEFIQALKAKLPTISGYRSMPHDEVSAQIVQDSFRIFHDLEGQARLIHQDQCAKLFRVLADGVQNCTPQQFATQFCQSPLIGKIISFLEALVDVKQDDAEKWLETKHDELQHLSVELSHAQQVQIEEKEKNIKQQYFASSRKAQDSTASFINTEKDSDVRDHGMLELFCQELETHSKSMLNLLLKIEKKPVTVSELLPLMRAAHSIKGAARIVGFNCLVTLAHALEDCFTRLQESTMLIPSQNFEELLKAIDFFRMLINYPVDVFATKLKEQEQQILACAEEIKSIGAKENTSTQETLLQSSNPQVSAETTTSAIELNLPTFLEQAETNQLELETLQEPVVSSNPIPLNVFATTQKTTDDKNDEARASEYRKSFKATEKQERPIKVDAKKLSRLLGLAGECLVEAKWLQTLSGYLIQHKKDQTAVSDLLGEFSTLGDRGKLDIEVLEKLTRLGHAINNLRQNFAKRYSELDMFIKRHITSNESLYLEAIATRMRPFIDGIEGFPRLVREMSKVTGKSVQLKITGEQTPVDRDILEKINSPLNHLIRNAIDHGIETPEQRKALGKPIEGVVRLDACHRSGMLCITVADDGQGIDIDTIKKKAVEKKLIGVEQAKAMTDTEIYDFLFHSGFSTNNEVTEYSGRGVGLNIVQTLIEEVGGFIQTTSVKNQGTTFQLFLPLTLSVIRVLLVEIAGEPYAFPLARVERVMQLKVSEIEHINGYLFINWEGRNVGLIYAHEILERVQESSESNVLHVVLLRDRFSTFGVIVSRFMGERDVVVHEIESHLGKVQDISSIAFHEDGTPILILDVDDLMESIRKSFNKKNPSSVGVKFTRAVSQKNKRKRVLVADDSLTVREVEARLLKNHGYDVDAVINGLDAWTQLRMKQYDLLITDVDMPQINGIELVKMVKDDPSLKVLPVMIVSYKENEEDKLKGLQAGADYYLTKSSFHDETLLDAVCDLIGKPNE